MQTMPKLNKLKDHSEEKPTHGGARAGAGKPKGPPKESTTIRFDKAVYEAIETEAKAKGISAQKHINQILADHVKTSAK